MTSTIPERTNPFTWHSQQIEYKSHEGLAWAKVGKESEKTYERTNQVRDEILKGNPIFKDTRGTTHATGIGGREVVVLTNFPRAKLAVRGNQPLCPVQEFDVMDEGLLRHFFPELRNVENLV